MQIKNLIQKLGEPFTNFIIHLGSMLRLLLNILISLPYILKNFTLLIKEVYFCGVKSLIIISVSGWFVGMVLGLQGYNTLVRFGSVSMLGSVVALSLLRELGPVLTAILFASRAGTGITAGIGLMKSTEQLDAMAIMAVSPIKRVVLPKFLATIIAVPLLVALFNVSGIIGGEFVGVGILKLDQGTFWSQMQNSVSLNYDIINGLIKGFIFGIFVALISVYEGLIAKPTAEGVSSATTRTVVISSLVILGLDYILTALMF
jgi:phospholipid/cholesterol/gamma-HCH transport system permease protein